MAERFGAGEYLLLADTTRKYAARRDLPTSLRLTSCSLAPNLARHSRTSIANYERPLLCFVQAATMTAVLSFFPGEFTRLTPLTTFKELLREGGLADMWSSGFTESEEGACVSCVLHSGLCCARGINPRSPSMSAGVWRRTL